MQPVVVGDWIQYGNAKFGERYARAAAITGYDSQTLMNMVSIASKFEISRRRENLSWSHHETVAALRVEEQEKWLDRAAAERARAVAHARDRAGDLPRRPQPRRTGEQQPSRSSRRAGARGGGDDRLRDRGDPARDRPTDADAGRGERASAAREEVKSETVLRRYAAGSKLLQEFVLIEADRLPTSFLAEILGEQGVMVDRFMDFVSVAHDTEMEWMRRTTAQLRAQRIRRLVDGAAVVPPEDLDYDFDGWHVAMILKGRGAEGLARALSDRMACRALIADRPRSDLSWFGSTGNAGTGEVERVFADIASQEISAALGEARAGLAGWRLTYHEAQAALQVLLRKPGRLVRCRDVILEGAVLWDLQLATSLVQTFLVPLDDRGTGEVRRRTLSAYFEASRNVTSAAAASAWHARPWNVICAGGTAGTEPRRLLYPDAGGTDNRGVDGRGDSAVN